MSHLPNKSEGFFNKTISREQCKDTGLAMMLILLLIGYFSENILFYKLSIPVLVITMTVPQWLYPAAVIWFAFSSILGTIMSRVILTAVYFIIVIPIAFVRKLMKIDSLKLNEFGKGPESVMINRNHVYDRHDIEKPY